MDELNAWKLKDNDLDLEVLFIRKPCSTFGYNHDTTKLFLMYLSSFHSFVLIMVKFTYLVF